MTDLMDLDLEDSEENAVAVAADSVDAAIRLEAKSESLFARLLPSLLQSHKLKAEDKVSKDALPLHLSEDLSKWTSDLTPLFYLQRSHFFCIYCSMTQKYLPKFYLKSILCIDNMKTIEQQVIDLVNMQRSYYKLPALKENGELSRVAQYKSQDMINRNYFGHQSWTYGSPFNMMKNFGLRFSAAGENIAYGQQTPQAVMNAWMNSAGHRNNMLNRVYNQIGVGVAKASNGTLYWTQMFIKSL